MRLETLLKIQLAVWTLMALAATARAQSGGANLPAGTEISADTLEYLEDRKMMIGTGHVVVQQGTEMMSADYMTLNTSSQDIYARGHVVFRGTDRSWQGEELKYNLKTRSGDFGEFRAYVAPYYITAKRAVRLSENEYDLKDVTVTTCPGDDPDYLIKAREATLKNGSKLKAKGVVLYYGLFPFFYLPSLARTLDSHDTYFEFVPGYSSRQGGFLLGAYNFKIMEGLKGRSHLDYRSKRGVGVGQDFIWQDPGPSNTFDGELKLYYTHDDEPFKDAKEEAEDKDLVDHERYRIRLQHYQSFTDRDYGIAEVNYLSDPDVVRDFFDKEYRDNSQPENRLSLTHRGDKYTAGILVNKRLNDFYENVDRVPEVRLDAQRQRIADSPIYYETANSGGYLEKVNPEQSDREDYNSFRLDSKHTLFYPTKQFGYLNLIPRTGYRGTFYSDTFSSAPVTNTIISTDSNGFSSVTNEIVTVSKDGGSDLRNLFEIGLETSFKAFKAWDDIIVLEDGDGLRHISEPYANYTYNPEPNISPQELPQFDRVDRLDKRQDIEFGIRNKLQTRRHGSVSDLVDLNVFTTYNIEHPTPDTKDFDDISFKSELRLAEWLPVDFDGEYNPYESEFQTFNTQISYLMDDASTFSLEYRHRQDEQDLFSGEIVLFPNARWSFQLYARYDAESSELEEDSIFIQHTTDCAGYGVGFKQVDDEDQVWFHFWLTAFPQSSINLGN